MPNPQVSNTPVPNTAVPPSPIPKGPASGPTAMTTVSADPPSAANPGTVATRISARRLQAIQPFQVMEIVKQAAARIADGHPVIQLSIGEPDFTAPAPVVERLAREVRRGRTGYTQALGIEPLRKAIGGHYASRYGVSVDPARIMVTAGASAALTLICLALIDPGDEVLMTDPSYPCNRHFVAAADGIVNATPVGMAKYPGLPLPGEQLQRRHYVADIVYFPLETELLRQARRIGCRTLSGEGMAVYQAVRAFEHFTGLVPDVDRMKIAFAAFDGAPG